MNNTRQDVVHPQPYMHEAGCRTSSAVHARGGMSKSSATVFPPYASDPCDGLTDRERGRTPCAPGRIPRIDTFFSRVTLEHRERNMFVSMPFV